MARIYKILTQADWKTFQAAGAYKGSPVDLADGYIHFSTLDQLVATLNKHYEGQCDLEIVAVESDTLDACALKWEPARGSLFPHLYCDLPISAVTGSYTIHAQADGHFVLPEEAAA